jgi:hypothetical protein
MEVKVTASASGHPSATSIGLRWRNSNALTERICHSHPALDVGAATPIETFLGPGAMAYDSCVFVFRFGGPRKTADITPIFPVQ